MIFNALINGIPVTIEAETRRAAFLKTLEAISPSADKELRLYNISTMSDWEFDAMVANHPYIILGESNGRYCRHDA